MAVEMIGGPRLCEPLLATGLGRFTGAASRHANGPRKRTSPHWRSGWVSGASQRATTNSLGTTSQPCASLPPWHSGFNQLSLDPGGRRRAHLCAVAKHRHGGAPDHSDKVIAQAGALLSGRPIYGAIADQPESRGCLPRQPIHLNSVCPDAPIDRGQTLSPTRLWQERTISARLLRSIRSSNTCRAVRCCETKALGARIRGCNSGSAGAERLRRAHDHQCETASRRATSCARLIPHSD